jgi:ATP-dependent DNA helicase RecQ
MLSVFPAAASFRRLRQADSTLTPTLGGPCAGMSDDDDGTAPIDVLRRVWGYESFRGVQAHAIDCALMGRDCFVLMATGGGKSMCYSIPPLCCGRPVLVVSPLIALMIDQVQALCARGVRATFLGSAQRNADEVARAMRGEAPVIFVTPERLARLTCEEASRIGPCLLAVDEAHCASEWGHDFREDYGRLGGVRELFPGVPLMALTATATPDTVRHVVTSLRMNDPAMLQTTFDRPNLWYAVESKPRSMAHQVHHVVALLARHGTPAIVYAGTRADVDAIGAGIGARAVRYHAGLTESEREAAHRAFVIERVVDVMVATIAYGMGIDKPDVRQVVHVSPGKSLEAYYQESGRAGRDGLPSRCTMLVAKSDWPRLYHLVGTNAHARAGLASMRKYADGEGCRRCTLLRHFGEASSSPCGACDVCERGDSPMQVMEETEVDHSEEALALLAALRDTGDRFGATTIVDLARGAVKDKHEYLRQRPSHGGAPSWATRDGLRRVLQLMVARGYALERSVDGARGAYTAIGLAAKGADTLAAGDAVYLPCTRVGELTRA